MYQCESVFPCPVSEKQKTRLDRKGKTEVFEKALKALSIPRLYTFLSGLTHRVQVNSAALFSAEAVASHSLMMGVKSHSAGVHNSTGGWEKLNLEKWGFGYNFRFFLKTLLRVLGLKEGLTT